MLVVWLLRPALQKRFPLHQLKLSTYLEFLAWCTHIGRRQYALLRDIDAWNVELMQPIELPPCRHCQWQESYTVGMYLVGLARSKYWHGQLMANAKMRHRAARWYFRDGRQLLGLTERVQWQQAALESNFSGPDAFLETLLLPKDTQVPEGSHRIHQNVQDICQAWGKESINPEGMPLTSFRPNKSPFLTRHIAAKLPVEVNELSWLMTELRKSLPNRTPSHADVTKVMSLWPQPKSKPYKKLNKPFGVNLIGYARGELGIGEDVRMVAAALESAAVPFNIINVEPGAHVSQKDTSAERWMSESHDYAINIFCMTGIEMSRMSMEKGLEWLTGHYNIGLWPWELPEWPSAWQHAWQLVDELWGISHYTANAYSAAPVPVKPMPLPVAINAQEIVSNRQRWQLPEDDYLFVFSFDMNSTLSRKNPIAIVKGFLAAFASQPEKRVGLVIKVSHLNKKKPAWKPLEKLIGQDSRIYLISGELRKLEVLSLYKSCNCYVSLHRAEGFGRGLAEAQLLGLDLIATGYSGNMEFCTNNATHVVDYQLVPLKHGDYFYGEGQQWAEPDIQHAARLMQTCATMPYTVKHDYPLARFSPRYCGKAYRKRLEDIALAKY
ncbi:glycosyltransferase family 1 protein [Halomonas sp. FME16]|uniref:Glycosyltransferase family 1 protein n=2 Tax=Halomonas citrativorans TaxID=2742612 RepID=A0ABR9FGT7_9GAMM|nr:glycosyltransferase family 1 protein [Halomonas citrativorans]